MDIQEKKMKNTFLQDTINVSQSKDKKKKGIYEHFSLVSQCVRFVRGRHEKWDKKGVDRKDFFLLNNNSFFFVASFRFLCI